MIWCLVFLLLLFVLRNLTLNRKKKMSFHVQPCDIFDYFENVVNSTKAQNLHVFSIAVTLQCHSKMFKEHSKNHCCYCFK